MTSTQKLYESYFAVYDDELREDIFAVEEDLSFVDDLSDNELTIIMEAIFSEGEFKLNECVQLLDSQILSEESEMERMNRLQNKATRERKSAAATAKREKSAERERVGRKHAIKRMQVAAVRAGRNIADRAKTLGAGAASAAMGGAAEVGRKLSSAKEKVKGFLSNVKKSAKAGYSAAKKEFSGQAAKEAKARETGRQMRRAARAQASAARRADTSEFESKPSSSASSSKPTWRPGGQNVNRTFKPQQGPKPASSSSSKPTWRPGGQNVNRTFKPQQGPSPAPKGPRSPAPYRNAGVGNKSGTTSSSSVKALPPAKLTKKGKPFTKGNYQFASAAWNRKLADRLGENFDYILEYLINEGYAETFDQAVEVLDSFSDHEVNQIVENYYSEEREDLYDVVLAHLLDEGYADTPEDAQSIMANMSDAWISEILEG
jgi:hypothetical protein